MLPFLALVAVGVRLSVYVKETYMDEKERTEGVEALKQRFPDWQEREAVSLTAFLKKEEQQQEIYLVDRTHEGIEPLRGKVLNSRERVAANRLRNRG